MCAFLIFPIADQREVKCTEFERMKNLGGSRMQKQQSNPGDRIWYGVAGNRPSKDDSKQIAKSVHVLIYETTNRRSSEIESGDRFTD
jgi:hypothetical protein